MNDQISLQYAKWENKQNAINYGWLTLTPFNLT